jgi:hypothetical protein
VAEPVTYDKNTVTEENPFDGTNVTFIRVSNVHVGEKFIHDTFSYAEGTPDQVIDDDVHAKLLALGYDV